MAHESLSVSIQLGGMILQISLWMPTFTHMNSYSEVLQHMKVCPHAGELDLLQSPYLLALSLLNRRQGCISIQPFITIFKAQLLSSKSLLYSSHYLHIWVPHIPTSPLHMADSDELFKVVDHSSICDQILTLLCNGGSFCFLQHQERV